MKWKRQLSPPPSTKPRRRACFDLADEGFSGVDSFTYRVSDGQAFSQPATVTIVVSPPQRAAEDLNADGAVNPGDIAFLLRNYGKRNLAVAAEGDLVGDGHVGLADVLRVQRGLAAVPSPASAVVQSARRPATAVRRQARFEPAAVDEALVERSSLRSLRMRASRSAERV